MKHILFSLLALTFFSANASATPVWIYKVEAASIISGGKLKIYDEGAGNGYRRLNLKYKLQTSLGFKESTIPYNLPSAVFDPEFLAAIEVGNTADLGSIPHGFKKRAEKFKIKRESAGTFVITSSDGQFRIYPRSGRGAWKRVDFTIRGFVSVRLKGNLQSVGNE